MNPYQDYDAEDLNLLEQLIRFDIERNENPLGYTQEVLDEENQRLLAHIAERRAQLKTLGGTSSASPHSKSPPPATPVANQQTPPATKPPQSRNAPATDPKQNRNTAATNPPHARNEDATKTKSSTKRPHTHAGHYSQIDDLPPESKLKIEQILEQNSLNNAVEILAQDPPEGLGLRFTRDTLHRFRLRLLRQRRRAEADEARATAAALLNDPNLTDGQIAAASRHLIRVRLLELVMDPTSSLDRALALQLQADRLRQTDLAERRLALAEKKLNSPGSTSVASP